MLALGSVQHGKSCPGQLTSLEGQNYRTSKRAHGVERSGPWGIGVDASIATLDEIQHAKERGKVMRTTEADPDDPWTTQAPHEFVEKEGARSLGQTSKGSSMYPSSPAQVKAIHAILGKQGIKEDVDKLAKVNQYLTGHMSAAVTTVTELDKHTASQFIDWIQANPP